MTQRNKFEWDDDNEGHIAKHEVDRYEAMEAAEDPAASIKRVATIGMEALVTSMWGRPRMDESSSWWWTAKARATFA